MFNKFWFNVKLPADDLKIETCRSISGFDVTVYILIVMRLLGLSFNKPQITLWPSQKITQFVSKFSAIGFRRYD